jgi:hypothetical protein
MGTEDKAREMLLAHIKQEKPDKMTGSPQNEERALERLEDLWSYEDVRSHWIAKAEAPAFF